MIPVYKSGHSLVREIKHTEMPLGSVAIWSLGQSGVLIKGGKDEVIAIDPYLTYSIEENDRETEFRRAFQPPLDPEDLKNIRCVLVTHFHDDHLDKKTLKKLSEVSDRTTYVMPASHISMLKDIAVNDKNIISAKADDSFTIGGFHIMPIAVAHTEYEKDEQGNDVFLGYFIEGYGVKLFHSGDTILDLNIVEKARDFNPDVAFLPINGGDFERTSRGIIGNMNFRDACDLAVKARVDMLIPVHYDLFPNNRDSPAYFVDYLLHTYPWQKFHMMAPGERFIYYK